MISNIGMDQRIYTPPKPNPCRAAAISGDLKKLKNLHAVGYSLDKNLTTFAAAHRRTKILDWLFEQGFDRETALYWDPVRKNDFEMVKCLHKNKCPLSGELCEIAAGEGNLRMLKWLYVRGAPLTVRGREKAQFYEKYEVVEWLDSDLSKQKDAKSKQDVK